MTCTVQTHIETYCGLSKNKTCKTVDNTHHTSMVCVYTEKFILVIDILDTFIQKLIQTYKGPTKNYLQTNNTQTSCIRHKNIYMHACNKDCMHACICRKGGWKVTGRFVEYQNQLQRCALPGDVNVCMGPHCHIPVLENII